MITAIWKFLHEKVLSNVFSISLLLLGTLILVIAVSLGPKLLQKEKKNKRGAIEKKVENAFKKVDNEIGSSIEEEFKQVEEKKVKEEEDVVKEKNDESLTVDASSSSSKGEENISKASISSKRRTRRK